MALERFFFGTHHGDPTFAGLLQQMSEAALKCRRARDLRVADFASFEQLRIFGACAQLVTQELIADTGLAQARIELAAIELRIEAAERHRAHVRQNFDLVLLQQRQKVREWMIRMPDAEE